LDSSLEKQLLTNFLFYLGITLFFLALLVTFIIKSFDDNSALNFIFIAMDSFMAGYFSTRTYKFYKKYILYKKFGVRGTWGE